MNQDEMQIKPMSESDQLKYYNIVQQQQQVLMSSIQQSPKQNKQKQRIEKQIQQQPKFEVPIPSKKLTDKTPMGLKPKIIGNGFNTQNTAKNNKDMVREIFKDIQNQQKLKESTIEKEVQKQLQQKQKQQEQEQEQDKIQNSQVDEKPFYQYQSINQQQKYKCNRCGKELNFHPLFEGDEPQNLLCQDCIQKDTQQMMQNIIFQPQIQQLQQYDINQLQQQINQKENIVKQNEQLQNKDNYTVEQNQYDETSINEYKFEIEILKQQLKKLQLQYQKAIEQINLDDIQQINQQNYQYQNIQKQFPFIIQKTVCPCCGEVTSVKLIELKQDQQEQKQQQEDYKEDYKQKQLKMLYLQQLDNQLQNLQNDDSFLSNQQVILNEQKTQQDFNKQPDNLSITLEDTL